MKQKEKKELHEKTIEELKNLLHQVKEDLFLQKMDIARQKSKNTRSVFLRRKEIAVIKTILQAKVFSLGKQK